MNFLSHFYFDRHCNDPDRITGMVLPDLVKNANKTWSLHPEKSAHLFAGQPQLWSLFEGWKRHLLVDRWFHSSDFFCEHTGRIKSLIVPVIADTCVRPSFVAHISLELMLDSLLLTENIITPDNFYTALADADRSALETFLKLNRIGDPSPFFLFFDEFISSAYLDSYRQPEHIMYALGRICMRLWANPFNAAQRSELTAALIEYIHSLKNDYMLIFDEIDQQVNPGD